MTGEAIVPGFEALHKRLARISPGEPLDAESLEAMGAALEELRAAEEELLRQNEELVQVHAAVSAEARRFQRLFEASPIATLVTSPQGIVQEVNAAGVRLFGAPVDYLVGKPLAEFVELRDRKKFRQRLLAMQVGRTAIDIFMRMRRRDGVAFDAHVAGSAAGSEVLWAIADESILRQAEAQLWELNRDREQRIADQGAALERVLEELPVGVAVLVSDGSITRANERARQSLGAPRAGARIADWLGELRHLDGSPMPRDEWPTAFALGGMPMAASRYALGDRVIEFGAAPLPSGAVVKIEDVTASHTREQAEREFISNAAHQIRTPITIIASVLAALEAGGMDDPKTARRFLGHIDGAVSRLAGLAEALLTLARLESGVPAEARVVPLEEVIARAVGERDVVVSVEPGCAALADEALLIEALANVIDNAFSHGQPPVEVTARRVDRVAQIDVRDHGPGIRPGDRDGSFKRFVGKGSGLGLSITKDAVRALRGTVALHDADGGGLLVRIRVPGARIV